MAKTPVAFDSWFLEDGEVVQHRADNRLTIALWGELPSDGHLLTRIIYSDGTAEIFANHDYISRTVTQGKWEWGNFSADPKTGNDAKKGAWLRPDAVWNDLFQTVCEMEPKAVVNGVCGYRADQDKTSRNQVVSVSPVSAGTKAQSL